jgi:hypothetical protein
MKFLYITILVNLSIFELLFVSGAVTSARPAENKLQRDKRELEGIYQKALDSILTKLDEDEERLKRVGKKATCTRKNLRYRLDL